MKYLSEYRDPIQAKHVLDKINKTSTKEANLMEVCGTHTVAISKFALRQVMPESVRLISGPGCPVCVTANKDIDTIIALSQQKDVIITTFGDMIKVPGSYSSFTEEKAKGHDIRIVYSALDAIETAKSNEDKEVIFFAVGFETTAPTIAASILEAKKANIKNFSVLTVHKLVPPALKALLDLGEVSLNGFILPGHVSTIIGSKPYQFLADDYKVSGVVVGFEPLDILLGIYFLVRQIENGEAKIEVEYKRTVTPDGNKVAIEKLYNVFEPADADWRGIGIIPGSGLKLRDEFSDFDALRKFDIEVPPTKEPKGCRCGDVLRGVIYPYECPLFKRACNPETPMGPCMVSSEGACAAYYRYEDFKTPSPEKIG